MDLRPPTHQSPSPSRASDPLYDNCPCPVGQQWRSREPRAPPPATPPPLPPGAPVSVPALLDNWDISCWVKGFGGRGSNSSGGSLREEPGERNPHESTLSVYDNLDPPVVPAAARPEARRSPAPPEDSGDSSSWSSCEIILEEAKQGHGAGPAFGLFPFGAETLDPPADFQALIPPAAPDPDPPSSPSTVRYLVVGLKQQMAQQKEEYEAQIRSLEKRNEALQGEVSSLRVNLEQHRRWHKMAEIKMRNAGRARADADRRNTALQQEMEQFFDNFGELNNEAKRTERIVQGF